MATDGGEGAVEFYKEQLANQLDQAAGAWSGELGGCCACLLVYFIGMLYPVDVHMLHDMIIFICFLLTLVWMKISCFMCKDNC